MTIDEALECSDTLQKIAPEDVQEDFGPVFVLAAGVRELRAENERLTAAAKDLYEAAAGVLVISERSGTTWPKLRKAYVAIQPVLVKP